MLKRKTLSSVQIYPGIEDVAAKSSHLLYSTLRATHRALFGQLKTIDNNNYSMDQRNNSITSLSLHLTDSVNSLSFPITRLSRFAYSRVKHQGKAISHERRSIEAVAQGF